MKVIYSVAMFATTHLQQVQETFLCAGFVEVDDADDEKALKLANKLCLKTFPREDRYENHRVAICS